MDETPRARPTHERLATLETQVGHLHAMAVDRALAIHELRSDVDDLRADVDALLADADGAHHGHAVREDIESLNEALGGVDRRLSRLEDQEAADG